MQQRQLLQTVAGSLQFGGLLFECSRLLFLFCRMFASRCSNRRRKAAALRGNVARSSGVGMSEFSVIDSRRIKRFLCRFDEIFNLPTRAARFVPASSSRCLRAASRVVRRSTKSRRLLACGQTKRPFSRRLLNRHRPCPSQQRILIRSPRRPRKTNNSPVKGSCRKLLLHLR